MFQGIKTFLRAASTQLKKPHELLLMLLLLRWWHRNEMNHHLIAFLTLSEACGLKDYACYSVVSHISLYPGHQGWADLHFMYFFIERASAQDHWVPQSPYLALEPKTHASTLCTGRSKFQYYCYVLWRVVKMRWNHFYLVKSIRPYAETHQLLCHLRY